MLYAVSYGHVIGLLLHLRELCKEKTVSQAPEKVKLCNGLLLSLLVMFELV